MSRLEVLMAEQEALLPVKAAEWIEIGLSIDPADRAAAEVGVRLAYEAAGLVPPRFVVWLGSPLAGAWGQAFAPVLAAEALKNGQVRDQVYGQVRDQVYGQVSGQVRDQVSGQVQNYWRSLIDPWYSIAWSAWFDTFATLGITGTEPWQGIDQIGRNADWCWTYADIAILTDRPCELHRDPQGRLHHETGPAIAYRDGWALHFWHGTCVPADLVEQGWDSARIFAETNTEIRRCAIERNGWDRFVIDAGLKQIGPTVPDPGNPGQHLALYDIPRDLLDSPLRVLLCTNGTPEGDGTRHRFGLTTPVSVKTPLEAAAWGYGLTAEQYAACEVRR